MLDFLGVVGFSRFLSDFRDFHGFSESNGYFRFSRFSEYPKFLDCLGFEILAFSIIQEFAIYFFECIFTMFLGSSMITKMEESICGWTKRSIVTMTTSKRSP